MAGSGTKGLSLSRIFKQIRSPLSLIRVCFFLLVCVCGVCSLSFACVWLGIPQISPVGNGAQTRGSE